MASEYWSSQVVLVTGASRGIGRALAIGYAKLGCRVAINYVQNESAAQQTLKECASDQVQTYRADVSDAQQVKNLFRQVEQDLGAVTILVNNAGITRDGLIATLSDQDWHSVIGVNLNASFFCSRAALKNMIPAKFGRILNVSSTSGIKGIAGQANYSAAKAGLIGFTKGLAKEIGGKNITCNALALGLIDTDMAKSLPEAKLNEKITRIALRRLGRPQEVFALAQFLTGPEATYITGEVITVDGGM